MSVRNHLCGLWDLVPISLLSAAQGCGGQVTAPATSACASVRPPEGPRGGHQSAQHGPILSLSTAAFYFKLCVSVDHFLPLLDVSQSTSQETWTPLPFQLFTALMYMSERDTDRESRGRRLGQLQLGPSLGLSFLRCAASSSLVIAPGRGRASPFPRGESQLVCYVNPMKARLSFSL